METKPNQYGIVRILTRVYSQNFELPIIVSKLVRVDAVEMGSRCNGHWQENLSTRHIMVLRSNSTYLGRNS